MCSDARIEYRHRWIKQRIRTLAYENSKSTAERTWNGDDMIRWLTMLNRGFHISDYGMLALSSFTSHWRQSVQHSYVHASARKSGHDGWNRFPVIGCFLGWTFIEILQDICLREVGVTISTLWMMLHRSLEYCGRDKPVVEILVPDQKWSVWYHSQKRILIEAAVIVEETSPTRVHERGLTSSTVNWWALT